MFEFAKDQQFIHARPHVGQVEHLDAPKSKLRYDSLNDVCHKHDELLVSKKVNNPGFDALLLPHFFFQYTVAAKHDLNSDGMVAAVRVRSSITRLLKVLHAR